MTKLVERTMISAGEIGGQPRRAGQIVTLDPIQLKRAADAGLVHEDASANDSVPKADLPAGTGGAASFEADIQEAAASASRQIEAFRNSVVTAQADADREIAGHRQRVTDAGTEADGEIAAHRERVSGELTRLEAELDAKRKALAETPPASGSNETPSDDAEKARGSKPRG